MIVGRFQMWYSGDMTELSIKNIGHGKRIIFLKGKQKDFLEETQTKLDLTLKDFADFVGICVRSMVDWKREKYSISSLALKKICQKTQTPLPKNIKIKDRFWYAYKGGRVGGLAVYKKYGKIGGNSEYRKKKWREWWEKEGKFRKHSIIIRIPIRIPQNSSPLAEFIGIILGDGSIAPKQIRVTLNKFDDKYFIRYVKRLFYKLFRINTATYERKGEKAISIVASRSELVDFLVSMGLKIGGKVRQQVGVPRWIKKSECFIKACLRGLFDTDGCFYVDKHKYKNKIYLNAGMNFTNHSLPILQFFGDYLERLGFHPTRKKFSILLRKEKEIFKYFRQIGSSNSKHLNKFKRYLQGGVG